MARIISIIFLTCFVAANLYGQGIDSIYTDVFKRDNITKLSDPASSQRQIITAAQIRMSGYTRLSDLMQLIDAWTFTSVNGDRWYMQSNSNSHYQNQNWVLMLNGQRVNISRIDAVNLNMLGVSVFDIERIEVVNTPNLYLNEYSDKGLIHIVTKQYQQGLTVKAMVNNGNETGDPGPYRYTQSNRSNINRIGENYAVSAGYASGRFFARTSFNQQHYYARGEDIRLRYTHFNHPELTPRNTIQSGYAQIGYAGKKWLHQFQGHLSNTGDFTFITPYSTELRNLQTYYSGGYTSLFKPNTNSQIRLSLTYDQTDVEPSPTSYFLPVIKTQQTALANLSYTKTFPYQKKNGQWQAGVALEQNTFQYFSSSKSSTFQLLKPYGILSLPVTRKGTLTTDAMLVSNNTDLGYKATVGFYKRVDIITNWNLVLSHTNRLVEEDNNMVSLMANRSEALALPNAVPMNKLSNQKQFSADFFYGITIGNNFKLIYQTGIKQLTGQAAYLLDTSAFYYNLSTYSYQTNLSRINWLNRIYAYYNVLDNFIFHINYLRNGRISGDEAIVSAIPLNKFTFTTEYQLPKNFQLWGRLTWQSATEWKAANAIDSTATNARDANTPELFLIDAGIGKTMLKNRLHLNLTLRNLLNNKEMYHPLGADIGLRMFVTVALQLEGIRLKRKS